MDFLDFETHDLYFDEPLSVNDEILLINAANAYPDKKSEEILLDLQERLPTNLTIMVALYRFYYYQHRYHEALSIADTALQVSAAKMGLQVGWENLTENHLGNGVFASMGLIRFYMLGLKASAYLLLRVGDIEQAYARLKRITELDPGDQFGADFLFKMAEKELSAKHARQHNIDSLFHR